MRWGGGQDVQSQKDLTFTPGEVETKGHIVVVFNCNM